MYSAALCDDDPVILKELCSALSPRFPGGVTSFDDAGALLRALAGEEKGYALFFLDIELQAENGIEVAERIHGLLPEAEFIFITAYSQKYMQQIFLRSVVPLGFLTKPIDQAILAALVDKALKTLDAKSRQTLILHNRAGLHRIPYSRIFYCESRAHTICVHLQQETLCFTGKLDDLEKQLAPCFIRIHKSFLVNRDKILSFAPNCTLQIEGAEKPLPVSRTYWTQVRRDYFLYRGTHL